MSHLMVETDPGTSPLAKYNSLTDNHLAGYFSSPRKRKHLRKAGLITRSGHLVSENTYRLNMVQKEHKKRVKNMLAQAIVEKTLDLERHRNHVIRQKLEEIAKLELVQRIREEEKERPITKKSSRPESAISSPQPKHSPKQRRVKSASERKPREDNLPYLSPRSPRRPVSGPAKPKPHSPAKYRPISAPENNHRPESGSTKASTNFDDEEEGDVEYLDVTPRRNGDVSFRSDNNNLDYKQLYTLNAAALRKYAMTLAKLEQGRGSSSPYVTTQVPIPPRSPRAPNRSARSRRYVSSGHSDRSLQGGAHTAPGMFHSSDPPTVHPRQLQSVVQVVMRYHGWNLSLARDDRDPTNLVLIEQQHCGGNTLTVFKDNLLPNTEFSFSSHRHRGYPFSLTIYVDGRMDCRVSTCCEHRHSKNVRIGGPNGHFSLVSVTGNSPCYKCQVERGGKKKKKKKQAAAPEDGTEEVIVMETHQAPENQVEEKKDQTKDEDDEESEDEGKEILVPVEKEADDDNTSAIEQNEIDSGDYDDDFEDDGEEEDVKSKKVENYNILNASLKERGTDERNPSSRSPDNSSSSKPTYTFLEKSERSGAHLQEEEEELSKSREITLTNDKGWVITVKGPDGDAHRTRSESSSIGSEAQEVALNKDTSSIISLKGESGGPGEAAPKSGEAAPKSGEAAPKSAEAAPKSGEAAPVDPKLQRIKSAKGRKGSKKRPKPSSPSSSSSSSSVHDLDPLSRRNAQGVSDPGEDSGRISVFGSRAEESYSSCESDTTESSSTLKSRSTTSSSSQTPSESNQEPREESKKTSIEDELQSAEQLLKELENDINTADEVSDIETEAESPRRQLPSKRKVTFREEVSFASDVEHPEVPGEEEEEEEEDESSMAVRVPHSPKSKDMYRSRENLSISDSEDDSVHGYRKTQSSDKQEEGDRNNSNVSHGERKLSDIPENPTDRGLHFSGDEEERVRSDREKEANETEEDTPRCETSFSDARGDEKENEDGSKIDEMANHSKHREKNEQRKNSDHSKQQDKTEDGKNSGHSQHQEKTEDGKNSNHSNPHENNEERKKSEKSDNDDDGKIDDFLKKCMDEAKDLVGNQLKLITESRKESNSDDSQSSSSTTDSDTTTKDTNVVNKKAQSNIVNAKGEGQSKGEGQLNGECHVKGEGHSKGEGQSKVEGRSKGEGQLIEGQPKGEGQIGSDSSKREIVQMSMETEDSSSDSSSSDESSSEYSSDEDDGQSTNRSKAEDKSSNKTTEDERINSQMTNFS